MYKTASILILIILIIPMCLWAQDAKLPPEAAKVMEKYDKTVTDAKKVYDSAVNKAREQALKDLKPIQTTETKKGNLDGALLVKSKIEELTAEIPKPAAEGDLAKPLPPNTDPKVAFLLGKWKVTVPGMNWASTWEFKDKYVMVRYEKLDSPGKYAIEKEKVIITWEDGEIDTLRLPKHGVNIMEGSTNKGTPQRFEKKEEDK